MSDKERFVEFLESLKGRSLYEVHQIADDEYIKNRKLAKRYAEYIGQFLFWVQNGIKPNDIPFDEFLLYKPLCEDLVTQKRLHPSALDEFTQE